MAISNAAHQVWEKMKLSSSAACGRGQRKIRSLQWPPVQCTRIRVVRCGELVMKLMHRGAFERLDHTAVTECLPCLWIKSRQIHDTYNYKQTHTYIPYKKPTSIINNPQFFGNGLDSFMIFGPLEWWGDPTLCRPGDLVTQRLVAQLISHASGENLSFVVLSILTKNRLLHATTPFHPLVDPWLSFSLKRQSCTRVGWWVVCTVIPSSWIMKITMIQQEQLFTNRRSALRNSYTEKPLHRAASTRCKIAIYLRFWRSTIIPCERVAPGKRSPQRVACDQAKFAFYHTFGRPTMSHAQNLCRRSRFDGCALPPVGIKEKNRKVDIVGVFVRVL